MAFLDGQADPGTHPGTIQRAHILSPLKQGTKNWPVLIVFPKILEKSTVLKPQKCHGPKNMAEYDTRWTKRASSTCNFYKLWPKCGTGGLSVAAKPGTSVMYPRH